MAKKEGNVFYDLNRPVHLARTYAFFEKTISLFQECAGKIPARRRTQLIDGCLYYLRATLEHAKLASKSTKTNPLELSFLTFIRLILISLYSARLLMDNELLLGDNRSPLWQFLHRRGKVTQDVKFARNSAQVLEDVSHLFNVSREPLKDLQQHLLESMNEAEIARYKKAYEGLREHLIHSRRIPRSEEFFQIFSQALEMKNE